MKWYIRQAHCLLMIIHSFLLTSAILRKAGPLWIAGLMVATVDWCHKVTTATDTPSPPHNSQAFEVAADLHHRIVQELQLDGCWDLRPFYCGEELKVILPNIPHGPRFREVTENLV